MLSVIPGRVFADLIPEHLDASDMVGLDVLSFRVVGNSIRRIGWVRSIPLRSADGLVVA